MKDLLNALQVGLPAHVWGSFLIPVLIRSPAID